MDQRAESRFLKLISCRRRVLASLTALATILLLADAGLSILVAHKLTIPVRRPLKSTDLPPAPFDEVRFPARDDRVPISAWYLPPRTGPSAPPQRAVILVHGKDDNRASGFDSDRLGLSAHSRFTEFATKLADQGDAVLMIDLRGHGRSGPSRYTFGLTERRDVLGAVDWLRHQKGLQPGSIGVIGISMGAAASIGAAAEEPAIGAVVADSGYAEVASLAEKHWKRASGLPLFVLPTAKLAARLLYGVDLDQARPVDDLPHVDAPILLIHNQGDPVTPVDHARRLRNATHSPTDLWVVPAPGHANAYVAAPQLYLDRVTRFFDRHLAPAPQSTAVRPNFPRR
jgi:dipeptidyl aminopeptidase/acylaminoacyl peptidase